jgi:hypothetical protein
MPCAVQNNAYIPPSAATPDTFPACRQSDDAQIDGHFNFEQARLPAMANFIGAGFDLNDMVDDISLSPSSACNSNRSYSFSSGSAGENSPM